MLCTDGLVAMLRDDQLARLLQQPLRPEETARRLIATAKAAGARDNIALVVVQVGFQNPLEVASPT